MLNIEFIFFFFFSIFPAMPHTFYVKLLSMLEREKEKNVRFLERKNSFEKYLCFHQKKEKMLMFVKHVNNT
jgi:hypothetical protein